MKQLSNLTNCLYGQPMFSLLEKAREIEKKNRVLHFEIGDPSFSTPENIIKATVDALYSGNTHYANSGGVPECREAVQQYVEEIYKYRPDYSQINICVANAAIDFICRLTTNMGEEIMYPDPGFSTYYSCIVYNGFVPIPIPILEENNYAMLASDIERRITKKTRLIIINSSHNPTGAVYTEENIREIYKVAEKYNLFILSDEVYSRIIYDSVFYSPTLYDFCKEHTILLGSLSKTYAMTGWRLGYVVSPSYLASKLSLMIQTVLSCLPTFLQYGMIEALTGDNTIVNNRVLELKERRDALINGLNTVTGMNCLLPGGAFYAYPNIKKTGLSCEKYSELLLLEEGVCVVPGTCFGENGKDHVRLCYASSSISEIEEAIIKIARFNMRAAENHG